MTKEPENKLLEVSKRIREMREISGLTEAETAEKTQVSFMVGHLLGQKPTWAVDAGDALACAICHLNMRRMHRLMQ